MHTRIRKSLLWAWRMLVVFGPILLPCVFMCAFVLAALTYVGAIDPVYLVFACAPYMLLCVIAVGMCCQRTFGLAWLLAVLPAVGLACMQAEAIASHVEFVRANPYTRGGVYGSLTPASTAGIGLAFLGVFAIVLITAWSAVVACWVWARRRSARSAARGGRRRNRPQINADKRRSDEGSIRVHLRSSVAPPPRPPCLCESLFSSPAASPPSS